MSDIETRNTEETGEEFGAPLTIGLVNNMTGARTATERQFRQILSAAGVGLDVRLRCYCAGGEAASTGYANVEELFESELDGIIVTGAEPKRRNLREEPLWPTTVRLVDWAEARGTPAIWSCLAAHAAVFYLDGIHRRRLPEKLSGVFPGAIAKASHPLMHGVESPWVMPHSRWNDLPESELDSAGYSILARTDEAGADVFAKSGFAPFVFFQGHPEYEADTLLREFRRDARRYQLGEHPAVPSIPRHYFPLEAEIHAATMCNLYPTAEHQHENAAAVLAEWGRALGSGPWRPTSVALYRNWLTDVALRKEVAVATAQKRNMMAHRPLPEWRVT